LVLPKKIHGKRGAWEREVVSKFLMKEMEEDFLMANKEKMY
jgi:hypothetical protein